MRGIRVSEPVLVIIGGSALILPLIYALLAAFNHPLNQNQQTAITALVTSLAALVTRKQTYSAATVRSVPGVVDAINTAKATEAVNGPKP